MKYKTILIDPPWEQKLTNGGKYKKYPNRKDELPYDTLTVEQIKEMPIGKLADVACHLWLWTTNQFLKYGFKIMDEWGFIYLAPITWVKPSGHGNWFVSRTQTCLFGYKDKCIFNNERYKPTVFFSGLPKRHSQKPAGFYSLIESISDEPRIELFARDRREGWDAYGDELSKTIQKKIN